MTTSSTDQTHSSWNKILELHCISGLKHFKKTLIAHMIFHASFLFLLVALASTLIISYLTGTSASIFAILIFSFILIGFTYLILILYFQAKKDDQHKLLKEWFVSICKKSIPENTSPLDYHLFLAQAVYHFAHIFQLKEIPLYLASLPLSSFQSFMKKCSYRWHAKDFLRIKRLLLLECIHEHLNLLKHDPINLEIHASLGNCYLTLASIYKSIKFTPLHLVTLQDLEEDSLNHFKNAIHKAIEEYKIIHNSAPNDPWVLAQLATCYHELEMYDLEIQHFEKILENSLPNHEVMVRLAHLYFQEGHHAQGFKLYQIIKETEPQKAEELFNYYIAKAKQELFL